MRSVWYNIQEMTRVQNSLKLYIFKEFMDIISDFSSKI